MHALPPDVVRDVAPPQALAGVSELLESARDADAPRTVLQTVLAPGAAVSAHYHTRFDETVAVVAGTLDFWRGAVGTQLDVGEAITVPRRVVHRYRAGPHGAALRLTFTPGDRDLERAMAIVRGVRRDGAHAPPSVPGPHELLFLAVVTDLTDAHPVDATKTALDALHRDLGPAVAAAKRTLLAAYAPF